MKRSREDETGDKVEIKRKKKVDNRMMEEESDKIMFEWKTLQKLWKKKKQESMSSETQKGAKVDIQWCKYTVMKRRTESMLDLAETKGALTQGFSGANPRRTKFKKRGRARGRDSHLLKKVLYWNHIKSEKV